MAAYLITVIDEIVDQRAYASYKQRVPELVARHHGTYVARSTDVEMIEGARRPERLLVLSFPDRAAVLAMFADPDYLEIRGLRRRATTGSIMVVDGEPTSA